jgi:chorismate dehydratase
LTQKIRVGAVSYLNTKPLIYGFEQGKLQNEVELVIDYPANIASHLINDRIDIGLVPVAVIPSLKEHHIISDYCIACNGEVASVCLFSDVPLAEIKTILLDYQSRTSVALLKILLTEHWNISPELIAATENYEEHIAGTTAGLVIGDRALAQRSKAKYIYDLGTAWKEMTGLPFVFAAWVSNKVISPEFITEFNKAVQTGLDKIEVIVRQNPYPAFNLYDYYTRCIQYRVSPEKMISMDLFLQKIKQPVKPAIKLN